MAQWACSGAAENVRTQAAAFLGCSADELLITRSTSEAMNTVAQSMRLNAGDRVLSSNQEHEGGTNCWEYLAERRGVVLDTVAITPEMDDRAVVASFCRQHPQRDEGDQRQPRPVDDRTHDAGRGDCRARAAEGPLVRRRWRAIGGRHAGGRQGDGLPCLRHHRTQVAPRAKGHRPPLYQRGCRRRDQAGPVDEGKKFVSGSTGVGPLVLVMGLGAAIEAATARGLADIERHNLALRNRAYAALSKITKYACGAEGQDRLSQRWCRSSCQSPSTAVR